MRAYLRGVGLYSRALKDGHFEGETADVVISIVMEYTSMKDAHMLRAITPSAYDINGKVNEASLEKDLAFYSEQGLIEGKVDVKYIVDDSFIKAAEK